MLRINALVLTIWLAAARAGDRAADRLREATAQPDRGDVPGWVMVTVMTAALVVFLLSVAKTPLSDAFRGAISKVTGAN